MILVVVGTGVGVVVVVTGKLCVMVNGVVIQSVPRSEHTASGL